MRERDAAKATSSSVRASLNSDRHSADDRCFPLFGDLKGRCAHAEPGCHFFLTAPAVKWRKLVRHNDIGRMNAQPLRDERGGVGEPKSATSGVKIRDSAKNCAHLFFVGSDTQDENDPETC